MFARATLLPSHLPGHPIRRLTIASASLCLHVQAMARQSPLDDPEKAAHAWARYRRVMRFMFLMTLGTVALAMVVIYRQAGPVPAHVFIGAALGIGFSMLLMSALMGLLFLSSGTGHDEAVENPLEEEPAEDGHIPRD